MPVTMEDITPASKAVADNVTAGHFQALRKLILEDQKIIRRNKYELEWMQNAKPEAGGVYPKLLLSITHL